MNGISSGQEVVQRQDARPNATSALMERFMEMDRGIWYVVVRNVLGDEGMNEII